MRYAPVVSVVALAIAAITLASVFVYYPLAITATPTSPGVKFVSGSNAGGPDIGSGRRITVTIAENETRATVSIHPTYQRNYYKDVLKIKNEDDDEMRVHLIFRTLTNTLPDGSKVFLIVYRDATRVKMQEITSPALNTPIYIGNIGSGHTWEIDFYIYIPGGKGIRNAIYSASIELVYTPSNETPPPYPDQGREG